MGGARVQGRIRRAMIRRRESSQKVFCWGTLMDDRSNMHNLPPSIWTVRGTVVVLAALAISVIDLSAKGPTVRIRIEGDTLPVPIEITERAVLEDFQVWDWPTPQRDAFVIRYSAASLPAPPLSWSRYKVTFFANRPAPNRVYTVVYQFDPNVNQGYIYVPRTELNSRTIWRGGMEEWWFRASASWERAVRPLVAQAKLRR